MLKLYYSPGACSIATHIFLEKIGKPYQKEAVNLNNKSAEFLTLNPEGAVPVLIDDDLALSQNLAIMEYLNDLYPNSNIFGSSSNHGKAIARKWLAFLNSDLHPKFYPLFHADRFVQSKEAKDEIQAQSKQDLISMYGKIEKRLNESKHLGENFSIVDLYLFATLRWAISMHIIDLNNMPKIKALFERIHSDPITQKVMKEEGLI